MFSRSEVKAKGKESFKKYYWNSVVAALVMGAATYGGSSGSSRSVSNENGNASNIVDSILSNPAIIAGIIVAILIAMIFGMIVKVLVLNNIAVGCHKFFIDIQNDESRLGAIVSVFKSGKYFNVALVMFLKDLFQGLWTLLFIIPGIIKSYEYRMIPYIMAENPETDRKEAFRLSKEMMSGNKWAAFVYDLSFIGWFFLSIWTCGILAVFYVGPYKHSANAALYETLKGNVSPVVTTTDF